MLACCLVAKGAVADALAKPSQYGPESHIPAFLNRSIQ